MSFAIKSGAIFTGAQAMAQPSRSTAEMAILDMPELLFWLRADTRDPTQSRLAFRDLAGGLLCQGYGTTALGTGINSATTMVFDGTINSKLGVGLTLPATYSAIMMYTMGALPAAASPMLSDPNYSISANPEIFIGITSAGHWVLKHSTVAGSSVQDNATLAINTNYISWASFDGNALQGTVAAANERLARGTATFTQGVSGASTMYVGGGTVQAFQGQMTDLVVLSVPIGNTAYATQRDNVLNYLASKGGITLSN